MVSASTWILLLRTLLFLSFSLPRSPSLLPGFCREKKKELQFASMEDATTTTKPRLLPKASSFSAGRSEKPREIDRKLSLGPIKLQQSHDLDQVAQTTKPEEEPEATLVTIADDIDELIGVLLAVQDPPEIPESTFEKFLILLEEEVAKFDNGEEKWPTDVGDELVLFEAIARLTRLSSALTKFSSEPSFHQVVNRAGGLLHHSMCVLEDEFFALFLQDPKMKQDAVTNNTKARVMPSFQLPSFRQPEPERSPQPPPPPQADSDSADSNTPIPAENQERMHRIAVSMISAGYEIECCQLFAVARRNAFEAGLPALGYEKTSIEEVLKMAWETLETDIPSWIKAFRHIMTEALAAEHELCEAVFAGHRAIADRLFRSFANCAIIQLLTFAEAVSMTKRSAEKLFKVLDIYEVLRDVTPAIDALLPDGHEEEFSVLSDPKTEMSSVKTRLGEAAVTIFCELEGSIKNDNNKTPVPGGAVHPLTRYTMNYLKYACEYKNTLEEVFKEHKHSDCDVQREGSKGSKNGERSPFAEQLVEAMDQLHLNLETKSKLYKDLALCNIFLMNNGRYVAKKVKGSPEIHQLAGETWYRRRSSDLRQYHKNYQRETWSKLLACLKDEGLHVKSGSVSKPLLKERFKSFNTMFEEIHKTQSSWVVSDEQLQSELRVSVSAVVVPAYRSFLGRFSQHLDPGRQTEKYIKYGAEDLESLIDDLFDGNPSANASKRRP